VGFDAVRIPVTWLNHVGASPSYTVDSAWMDRVEEVVNYALNAGLYVIINVHHDGANSNSSKSSTTWLSLIDSSGSVTSANTSAAQAELVALWAQIAERFKNYDQRLIFESMNEIHVGYDAPISAYYTVINQWNQAFVDTIRAGGGSNPDRCLVVPGYNTNIDYTVAGFTAPTDSAANRLIVSCHYYDPWKFAGAGTTHYWGSAYSGSDSWGQESSVLSQFNKLKTKYISQGIPVILGEYGAVNQTGYEDYRRYYMEYVTKAAHDRGIVPFYWDNNSSGSGSEAFGLLNRSTNSVRYQTILDAMVRAATSSYSITDITAP
jgi:aryl-phospho-beta-D-glucosidase BglC (GH1 family)